MNLEPTKYADSIKTHHFCAKTSSNYFRQYLQANNIFCISRKPFSPSKNDLFLIETNFRQPKMSSRSKWKSTIMDAELLIAKALEISRKKPKPLQATKSNKRLKYPDHKRPKLKTTKTIKWKRKRPKHTPSKTNTHAKTNHAFYKPQNTFSQFPLLPKPQNTCSVLPKSLSQ